MAASGLKVSESTLPKNVLKFNKTTRLINMAFDIMKYVDSASYGKNGKIEVKIGNFLDFPEINYLLILGIHSGKVIAGVIGYHKPQFSLIGDTVNTTSRVCSTGEKSKITISEEAMLETRSSDFYFIPKAALAKGKGNLANFQVERNVMTRGVLFRAKVNSALQTLKSRRLESEDKNKTQTNLLLKILNFLQTDNTRKPMNDIQIKIPKNFEESPENSPSIDAVKQQIQKELDKKNSKVLSEQARQDFTGRRRRTKKVLFDPISENEDWFYEKSIVNKLTPHGIFLKIPVNQTNLFFTYKRVLMSKNYREIKIIFIFFFFIYLIKTFVLISLRKLFENNLFFLIYRGGFSMVIIATVLTSHQFTKNRSIFFKKICSKFVMAFYFYGLTTPLIEIQNADIKEDFLVAFLELMIICLVYTNIS